MYTLPMKLHFTIDCDWVPGSEVGLVSLLSFCDRWKLKATIFLAGRFAEAYPCLVDRCAKEGHELGTHGWEHGGLNQDEDFRTAGYEQQRQWIRWSTEAVEKASGVRPIVFRAPNLWMSETTLRILEEEGYRYDSSIPAGRFDCGFGRVHYFKYFWAPAAPYYPASHHLSRRGDSAILEVPPSAYLFPVNLASLRVLGLGKLRWMIRQISRRSSRLVFYCHPYEFVQAHEQSFPLTMSKWNQSGMHPDNLVLLDTFVEHMMRLGYSSEFISECRIDSPDKNCPEYCKGTTHIPLKEG